MNFKTLIVAATLALAPALAMAQSCNHGEKTASSCIQGYVWDSQSDACVAVVSG